MKHFLSSIFVLILFVNPIVSKEIGKSVPEFMITEVRANNMLKPNEAVFVFTCKTSDNGLLKQSIKYSANGVNKIAQPNSNGKFTVKLKSGKYKFQFFLNTTHFEIYSDSVIAKSKTITEVDLLFKSSEIIMIEDKPVIYLYPQQKTTVDVKLDLKGELLFTYPTYNNGWEIEANPDGTLKHNNKEYNYLFWEGKSIVKTYELNFTKGFVIETENLISFLEEKLSAMGLNSKEQQDYITYWYPRMSANKSNYIHFLFNDEFAKYAQLNIEPKPDNLFRVFMVWSNAKDIILVTDMQEQEIPTMKRKGFTVVEWGGTEMNLNPINAN